MTNYPNNSNEETIYTIAFYNLENLFDIYDDELTNDNDFLPTSDKKWTRKRYENKLRKLGYSISNIGKEETQKHPTLIGFAEVENAEVLKDLIASKHMAELPYSFVHYDSPDERGIDVALIYDRTIFKVISSETFPVLIIEEDGNRDYTRDILFVKGLFDDEPINIIVNHWPSRREGAETSEYKRLIASEKVSDIISQIKQHENNPKIIVMGDFNDGPKSNSIKRLGNNNGLYNPMVSLHTFERGTTNYNFKWDLFDQILFSVNLFEKQSNKINYVNTNIFDADFLKQFHGKYKGQPFRTYVGKKYKGGYSDHFPVYMTIKKPAIN
ncbi:MAG TPA: endonuclease/exonuclease/phosphatase family protein [Flavobacteriaceae bacterium]|nr:endonuclease/exonuclease/phosphatase family protein [Flavobacteriaceae bacterium]